MSNYGHGPTVVVIELSFQVESTTSGYLLSGCHDKTTYSAGLLHIAVGQGHLLRKKHVLGSWHDLQ